MGRAGDSQYDDVSGSADPTKLSWLVKDATGTGTATKELLASTLSTLIGGGGGGGGVSDGDKGDIVISGTGTVYTIDTNAVTTSKIANSAVTYAKMQNVSATDRLLGRSTAGAGVVEEITCTATGRSLLAAANGAGVISAIGATTLAGYGITDAQPLDSDLTAIAALTTTSYGRSFLDRADATAARTHLGLGTLATLSSVGTAQITDANVTLAKLANSGAASVLLGRGAGSGAGVYQELTLGTNLSMSGTTLNATGGGTPGGSNTQLQYNNAGAFAGAADVTYSTGQLAITPAWSGTGTATTPLLVNVTADPGPANAASKLLDLQVGGVSTVASTKRGCIYFPVTFNNITAIPAPGIANYYGLLGLYGDSGTAAASLSSVNLDLLSASGSFSINSNVVLTRDAADVLAQRRSTNAQEFCVYNTFTSSTNFERGVLDWKSTANVFRIGTEKGSLGGTARAVSIITDGVERFTVGSTGEIALQNGKSLSFTGTPGSGTLIYSGGPLCLRSANGLQLEGNNGANGSLIHFLGHAAIVSASGGILGITNGSTGGGAIEFTEMTAPATPAADKARIFARDNGSGKTQVCIILPDGVVTVLATQT